MKLKRTIYFIFILSIILLISFSCNERLTGPKGIITDEDSVLVRPFGLSNRFEVATWNIENFPKKGTQTINSLGSLIKNLDIDLIAVQEIASVAAFDSLLIRIPQWKGHLIGHVYNDGSYQKTGFLYKSSFISVSNVRSLEINEYTPYGSAFPRPPLAAFVKVIDNSGLKYDFTMIVLHLKAFGGENNEARRRRACELLKNYIEEEIENGADPDFIVLGDWNDILDDEPEVNVFTVFLNDPRYSFLTANLQNQYSYIDTRYKSLIDHILITESSLQEYLPGKTEVLYLDTEYTNYPAIVSDHRPVAAMFEGFTLELAN